MKELPDKDPVFGHLDWEVKYYKNDYTKPSYYCEAYVKTNRRGVASPVSVTIYVPSGDPLGPLGKARDVFRCILAKNNVWRKNVAMKYLSKIKGTDYESFGGKRITFDRLLLVTNLSGVEIKFINGVSVELYYDTHKVFGGHCINVRLSRNLSVKEIMLAG
jgi:hypothetical protein